MVRQSESGVADSGRLQTRHIEWRMFLAGCVALAGVSAIIFTGVRLAASAPYAPTTIAQSNTPTPTVISKAQAIASARCGFAGKPACPTPDPGWVTLRSEAPADVLEAPESTIMYQSARTSHDYIAWALSTGTLEQPVLVRPYVDGAQSDTCWIIPVVSDLGYPEVFLDFVYDRPHHRLRAGSFMAVSNNMFYTSHVFPYISATKAAAMVWQARHVALIPGRSPELIYFFGVDHMALITGQAEAWTYGGDAAIDPMWRVPGADGHWYYVTLHDLRVRAAHDFSVSASDPPMPDLVK